MKSSTIIMQRIGDALCPADDKAEAIIRQLSPESHVAVRVLHHRDAGDTALYWRCLECAVKATGRWETAEELHLALKIATGRVDAVRLVDGRRVLVPQSTGFDQMTDDDARGYYTAALRIVCDDIMGGISIDDLLTMKVAA
jgi:hypothetical protein